MAGLAHRTRPALSSSSRSIHSAYSQQCTNLGSKQARTRSSFAGSGHSSSTLPLWIQCTHHRVQGFQTTACLHHEIALRQISAVSKACHRWHRHSGVA